MTEQPNEIELLQAEIINVAEKAQIGLEHGADPSSLAQVVLLATMTRSILVLAKQVQRIADQLERCGENGIFTRRE